MTPSRARQAGFSYIEILVGIMILAIVAGGIAQGIGMTSASIARSKLDTTASKIAAAALDRAHAMPYEDVGIQGGSPPGEIAATTDQTVGRVAYRTTMDVRYVDDAALGQPRTYVNYKKVTATVTPQVANARAVTQTTLVAPPSFGAIAGKSTIVATVIDAVTEQPLPGVPVTADGSTSPTQTRSTDADGTVVFAGLEPSAISSSDPKHRYRLSVGLPDPWVPAADSTPDVVQQHLAASQTWTTTLRVFKKATIDVQVRDAATGQLITETSEVTVTTPGPDVISAGQTGTTGLFRFSGLAGRPIMPSLSEFTVTAEVDCYRPGTIKRPVPTGYPGNTLETFAFSLTREASGYIEVVVRSSAAPNPALPDADVTISGGGANIAPITRTTDAQGRVRVCVPPSGNANYVVSATKPGYGQGSILASVGQNQTTPITMYLTPTPGNATIRLAAGSSGKLVRLRSLSGTYDQSQTTNSRTYWYGLTPYIGYADFTNLAAGDYVAYVATGFSGGTPTWSSGRTVRATASTMTPYYVP
ncbi:PulJ/GspJ family protein [Miltoncostaea marina]|uniref:PulJ/GspJ family protein n=1 Tax=Miltoncostaea marina TaxID=2843215 RepID=UPI001C3E003E|nr:prepilin-type N-terminal cleavage/methylation domain-containing protein [Miltoncostaea marina]